MKISMCYKVYERVCFIDKRATNTGMQKGLQHVMLHMKYRKEIQG